MRTAFPTKHLGSFKCFLGLANPVRKESPLGISTKSWVFYGFPTVMPESRLPDLRIPVHDEETLLAFRKASRI